MSRDNKAAYRALVEVQHFMGKAAALTAQNKKLTLEQARVLSLLFASEETMKPIDIARRLMREPHTITGLLSRMEQDRLVVRVRGTWKGHPNWVEVKLTGKGRSAYLALPDLDAIEASALDELSDKELETLAKLLGKVRVKAVMQVRSLTKVPWIDKPGYQQGVEE